MARRLYDDAKLNSRRINGGGGGGVKAKLEAFPPLLVFDFFIKYRRNISKNGFRTHVEDPDISCFFFLVENIFHYSDILFSKLCLKWFVGQGLSVSYKGIKSGFQGISKGVPEACQLGCRGFCETQGSLRRMSKRFKAFQVISGGSRELQESLE